MEIRVCWFVSAFQRISKHVSSFRLDMMITSNCILLLRSLFLRYILKIFMFFIWNPIFYLDTRVICTSRKLQPISSSVPFSLIYNSFVFWKVIIRAILSTVVIVSFRIPLTPILCFEAWNPPPHLPVRSCHISFVSPHVLLDISFNGADILPLLSELNIQYFIIK